MFTNQIANIVQRLLAAGMPTEEAQVIAEFGNCSGPLDHRAPVTIDKTPNAPSKIAESLTPTNLGDYYSTLRVSNWDSRVTVNEGDTIVEGGYTQIINGTLYVDYIVGPNGTYVNMSEVTTEDVFVDMEINADGDLEITRKRITVLKSEPLSNLIVSGETVGLVEDVDWTAPELRERKYSGMKVLKAGTLGDYGTVDEAEPC